MGVPVDYHKLFVEGDPVYLTILQARFAFATEMAAEAAEGS
jgi:hypothetical protein